MRWLCQLEPSRVGLVLQAGLALSRVAYLVRLDPYHVPRLLDRARCVRDRTTAHALEPTRYLVWRLVDLGIQKGLWLSGGGLHGVRLQLWRVSGLVDLLI